MTDPRPFFERRSPTLPVSGAGDRPRNADTVSGFPPASPPKLAPLMFADADGLCQDCHREPVVPYNPRCQGCAVRVAKRSAPGEGR